MARKGQKFKTWTTEEKYKIIKPIIEMETSLSKVAKQNIISNILSTMCCSICSRNHYDYKNCRSKK